MEFAGNLPDSREDLLSVEDLQRKMESFIGTTFKLTGKLRTDGVNLQKSIGEHLGYTFDKKKEIPSRNRLMISTGIPKIKRQLLYTYLATPPYSTDSYNLQMWNVDLHDLKKPLIVSPEGEVLCTYEDVKIIIAWVDRNKEKVKSVSVLTPFKLNRLFKVGKTKTIKNQAFIPAELQDKLHTTKSPFILSSETLLTKDSTIYRRIQRNNIDFTMTPNERDLFSLEFIGKKLKRLIGTSITPADVRSMSREAEHLVLKALGYKLQPNHRLHGNFPDIPHQRLEVKLQNQHTIDLGLNHPTHTDILPQLNCSPENIRYCIILTDDNNVITQIVLLYGKDFPRYFHLAQSESFKLQCQMPLEKIYHTHIGQVFA